MTRTDAGERPLSLEEEACIKKAWLAADTLYRGEKVAHHSCGASVAVSFGRSPLPYQSLRRGGILGKRFCGSIRGGELLLGELLGNADPTAAVSDELRQAMTWFQEEFPKRLNKGGSPDYICNNLTKDLGEFLGAERKEFCTSLTREVAALVCEAIVRFAPDKLPEIWALEAD